jgi:phenylalanine-4-hydroxylase
MSSAFRHPFFISAFQRFNFPLPDTQTLFEARRDLVEILPEPIELASHAFFI